MRLYVSTSPAKVFVEAEREAREKWRLLYNLMFMRFGVLVFISVRFDDVGDVQGEKSRVCLGKDPR